MEKIRKKRKPPRNYARFYCLLKQVMPQLDQDEAKQMVADQMSGGRTSSLRELTDKEFEGGVKLLEEQLKGSSSELRKARSSALHQLQKYGIDTADWDAVNVFVVQPRIAGKPFYHLSVVELKALTRKMRAINQKKTEGKSQEPKEGAENNNYQFFYIKTDKKVYGN